MKRKPTWAQVVISLALIAAVAIAAPAFGVSKSIKKAIQKEVAKQIGKATGPPGPSGPAGAPGSSASANARLLSLVGTMNTGDAPKVLDTYGPFTFTASCTDEGGGVTEGDVDISTTADNGYVDAFTFDADFDAADSPLLLMANSSATANESTTYEMKFYDGQGTTAYWDTDGENWGVLVNTTGADCRFFGQAVGPDS